MKFIRSKMTCVLRTMFNGNLGCRGQNILLVSDFMDLMNLKLYHFCKYMKYFAIFRIFAGLSLHTNFNLSKVFTKEEAKEIRVKFWEGFKRYCKRKHIYRKWVLTGVKIRSTQLKFYADREKALVLFQIDHKNELRRFEVYECMLSYQTLFRAECGDELKWEEEYTGIEGQDSRCR